MNKHSLPIIRFYNSGFLKYDSPFKSKWETGWVGNNKEIKSLNMK